MSIPGATEPAPIVIQSGRGVHLIDREGRRYLDMTAGLAYVNAGYSCRAIQRAMSRQMRELPTFSTHGSYAHPRALELADRLVDLLRPEGVTRILFGNSGTDAVESALKVSRQYWRLRGRPEKTAFLSFKLSYHGVGFGAMALSGLPLLRRAYGPAAQGFSHIDSPYSYRHPSSLDGAALAQAVAQQVEREIAFVGPDLIAGIVAEPVQCAAGAIVPPRQLWPLLRALCDRYDLLFIADEVVTGFGRTGEMFGSRLWNTAPDILCFAKGINSGYVPMSATAVGARVAAAWSGGETATALLHGHTHAGHPLACAAALANLSAIESDKLVENAAALGQYFVDGLRPLAHHPLVGEIRGRGLLVAVELVADRNTKAPLDWDSPRYRALRASLLRQGILVRWSLAGVLLTPPLIIDQSHADQCIRALFNAFDDAQAARLQ